MIAQNLECLKEGCYVDAKDKHGDWQVGLVLLISKTHIKIRFDGWPSRYDEPYPINTQRIKPFRSLTRGYTGQRKNPGVRQHWIFTMQTHEERLSQLQQFTSHLSQKSAFEINQYLRGQNYFYIDFLMTLTYNNKQELIRVYDYFSSQIQFVRKYLKQLIQRDLNIWFQAGDKQQNTAKRAYSQIYYQMFDSIYSIIGCQPRLSGFIRNNQKHIKQHIGSQVSYQIFLAKQLLSCEFVSTFQQLIQKVFRQTLSGSRCLPFLFINSMCELYSGLDRLPLPKQFKKKQLNCLVYVVEEYFASLSISDAKSNEKCLEELLSVIKTICNRSGTCQKQQLYRWIQKSRLKLWKFLIQSDVLQKKLRGINKIKEFYDIIALRSSSPLENCPVMCSKQEFRHWLEEQQLLKILFETNQHSEVIKRGCEMFQFFYASKLCPIGQIVYIWETCFKKHEAIKKIIFQLWNDLAEYVVLEKDWEEFIAVFTRNQEQINQDWEIESLISFLHSLKSDQNSHYQGVVTMLYRKTLDKQKYLSDFAHQVSFYGGDSLILKGIIDNCLKMISQKQQPIFHLQLLARIFNQLHSYNIYIPQDIVEILIKQLEILIETDKNERFINTIFHLFNEIMVAKDSATTLINSTPVKINFPNFQTLWNIFYNSPFANIKRIFYNWIVTKNFSSTFNSYTYMINARFSHPFRLQIFTKIICEPLKFNYQKMDFNQFIVFKEFFIYVNSKFGAFDVKYYGTGTAAGKRRILKVKSKDIQGLKQLWSIFRNCQSDEVIVAISVFIKDIHLRISPQMPVEQKGLRVRNLMQRIKQYMKEGQTKQQYSIVKRCLILLTKLLADVKQRIQIPKQFQKLPKTQKVLIKAFIEQNDIQQIEVYIQEPFINVKRYIAEKFSLPREEFILYNGRMEVQKQIYEVPYYLHHFEDNYFKIVTVANQGGKYIVGYILQHFYHLIIDLLKNNQVCTEAYNTLQYLEVHEAVKLYENLSKDIETMEQILKNKRRLYLHIYFLRVFSFLLQKDVSLKDSQILPKIISHLQMPIQSSLVVNYLERMIEILNKIMKKRLGGSSHTNKAQLPESLNFRPKTYKLMINLIKYLNRYPHYLSNHEFRLFALSIDLYSSGFQSVRRIFDSFVENQNFREFMFQLFIKCEIPQIKKLMEMRITSWLKQGFCSQKQEKKVAQFFINQLYYQIYTQSLTKPLSQDYGGLFKLLRTILEAISIDSFNQLVFEAASSVTKETFCSHIFKAIYKESDSPSSTNNLLNGQLNLLIAMIKRNRQIITQEFIQYLLFQCLIYVQGKTKNIDVKCLSKENILLILQILFNVMISTQVLSNANHDKTLFLTLDHHSQKILSFLKDFHYFQFWRSAREWNCEYQQLSKAKFQFVGLQNPGCICYLNSLLQQLYMIQEFRYNILSCKPIKSELVQVDAVQDSPELLPKLKNLFLSLMYSQRPAIDPQFFTTSIRNANNRPMVKIFEQMDIDQFSMILFDKIQNKLHRMKYPNFIRNLFGGLYSNEIISQECKHSSQRQQPFLSISLDVKKHITQGFQSLVKGQMLQGQNAYFCDRCDKKVKALKRLSIKKLPPHLIISLRRFEFDYEIDQKIKINKYCEFPFELNLQDYSQEKLNQLSNKVQKNPSMAEQDQQKQKKESYPSEYYIYKLKGVVVHTGSADSGHYYSFIQGKEGDWFQFNDQKVSQFDVKNLGEQAFGGKDGEYIRIKNAYLLFYERKSKSNFSEQSRQNQFGKYKSSQCQQSGQMQLQSRQQNRSVPTARFQSLSQQQPSKQSCLKIQGNLQVIEQIIKQNKKIRIFQFFFSKQYFQFVMSLVKLVLYKIFSIKPDQKLKQFNEYQCMLQLQNYSRVTVTGRENVLKDQQLMSQSFNFLVSYTFLVHLRQKFSPVHFQLFNFIRDIFFRASSQRKAFMQTFISQITYQSFFDEFFIYCTNRQKSKIVAHFVFDTLEAYLQCCYRAQRQSKIPPLVKNFIKIIISNIITTYLNISQLVMIIRKLVSSKKLRSQCPEYQREIVYYLLGKDFINTLLDNTLGYEMSKQAQQRKLDFLKSDLIFSSKPHSSPKKSQQRKDSDISASSEKQQNQKSKKGKVHPIQIQELQNIQQVSTHGLLFGYYKSEGKCLLRPQQKQTWTLLYMIYMMVKQFKRRDQLNSEGGNKRFPRGLEDSQVKNQTYIVQSAKSSQGPSNIQPQSQNKSAQQSQLSSSVRQSEPSLSTQQSQTTSSIRKSQSSFSSTQRKSSPKQNNTKQLTQIQQLSQQTSRMPEQSNCRAPSPQRSPDTQEEHRRGTSAEQDKVDQLNTNNKAQLTQQNTQQAVKVNEQSPQLINQRYGQVQSKRIQVEPKGQPCAQGSNVRQTGSHAEQTENSQELKGTRMNPLSQLSSQSVSAASSVFKGSPKLPRTPAYHHSGLGGNKRVTQPTLMLQKVGSFSQVTHKFYLSLQKISHQKFTKLISQQKDTKSMVAFCTFLSEIVFNNPKLNETIINCVQNGLKDYQSSKYRPFFVLIERLILIDDGLAHRRRMDIVRILRDAFRHNQKFYLECDFIQQWILRYVTKSKPFYKIISESTTFLSELKSWAIQKRCPLPQTLKKNRQVNCQRHAFRLHGIIVSGQNRQYENLSAYKCESFEKIKQYRFESGIKFSQYPEIGEQYQKNDVVELYVQHSNSWVDATVEQIYYGYAYLSFAFNRKLQKLFSDEDDEKIISKHPRPHPQNPEHTSKMQMQE